MYPAVETPADRLPNLARYAAISAGFLLAALGGFFAIKSVALAISLERPLAFFDQWVFIVRDHFARLDGTYSWLHMVEQHGEHRPVTARIILRIDAIFFNMDGWLPLFTQYVSLAAIAAIIARLAAETRNQFLVAFPVLLGLTWSISQYENLSWAFQTCFPFVHLFMVASVLAFAMSISDTQKPTQWLVAAIVFDFLAIFSIASGMMVIAPAICVAIWRRRIGGFFLIFAAAHVLICVAYFSNYVATISSSYAEIPSFIAGMDFISGFLGQSFTDYPSQQLIAGRISLLLVLAAGGWVTWLTMVRKKTLDMQSSVLLSIAVFVLAESVITAIGRVKLGLAPRYATAALVFQCSILAFYWRQTSLLGAREHLAKCAVIALTAVAIVGANAPSWAFAWKQRADLLERATIEFSRGQFDDATVSQIWPGLTQNKHWLKQYIALGLGPFRTPPDR